VKSADLGQESSFNKGDSLVEKSLRSPIGYRLGVMRAEMIGEEGKKTSDRGTLRLGARAEIIDSRV